MGFLHQLWDETLAGPPPETGLGKLRKYNSFSASSTIRPPVIDSVPISRSITIIRANSTFCRNAKSEPASPCGSTPVTPRTPSTPDTPGSDFKKFTRRKLSKEPVESAEYRR